MEIAFTDKITIEREREGGMDGGTEWERGTEREERGGGGEK